jgi:hypothetical protein
MEEKVAVSASHRFIWLKKSHDSCSPNFGSGRIIRTTEGPPNFHYTVKERVIAGYKPLATYSGEPVYVGRT